MSAKIDILSFEAGLIDELVETRSTALNHGRGARRCENFLPLPQGPAVTRPPSRFVAGTKGNGQARLFRVVYSDSYAYEVEFGNGYCRFFTNTGQIRSGGVAYEIVSPYGTADLAYLQAYNDAGTLYLVDGRHAPYRLVYSAETSWVLEKLPVTWGPFGDENIETKFVAVSGLSGTVTFNSSAFIFEAEHVGSYWRIGHRVAGGAVDTTFTANASGTAISVAKGAAWTVETTGTWTGTLVLERSYDGGLVYEEVKRYESASDDRQADDSGIEEFDNARYRLRMTGWTAGTSCISSLKVPSHVHYGYVQVTAVIDPMTTTATVIVPPASTAATALWSPPAWSDWTGYPRGIGVVDNRLALVGTTADPTTIWLSAVNQYTNFRAGSNAADALTFTFTTGRGDPFLWVLGEQYKFYIGTPSAIFEMTAADPRSAISAANKPEIARRIDFGVSAQPPLRAYGNLIVLDAEGLVPMKVTYDWEQDLLVSPDLAFAQPTLTEPGIKRMVFQPGRIPIVWFLRTDGVLLAMPWKQLFRQDIAGWAQVYTAGTDAAIEDIDVLPGSDGYRLWWIARRTIEGTTRRYVELMDRLDLQPERAMAHGLDSYIAFEGENWVAVEGLAVNEINGRITITATSHPFTNGDNIELRDFEGMTWLNDHVLTVADATANTFALKTTAGSYVDGRLLPTCTGWGRVRQVENTFSGLGHLEGESVYAVADGAVLGPYIVTSGAVTMPQYYNRVYVGYYVEGWLQPLRLVLPLPDGSSRGRQMTVNQVWLSVYRSWECRIGPDEERLRTVNFWELSDADGAAAPELVTGDFFVTVPGNLTIDPTVLVHRHLPLPLCIRGLMPAAGIGGERSART